MKRHLILTCAALSLGPLSSIAIGPGAMASTEAVAPVKWVGFCVRYAASNKRLRDAVLVVSSGDPTLDKSMRGGIVGMLAFHHTPIEKWVPLRVGPPDKRLREAEP